MKLRYCGILMALGWLLLGGCVPQQAVGPAVAVEWLRTGAPVLRCREACLGAWQQAQPQAAQLAAAGRWADLAALVENVGYQDDLSLYYLGLAAERLGYPGAAASYYRQSTYLTGTTIGCRYLSRNCGGYVFPRAALVRLAAIQHRLVYRPRPRHVGPGPRAPEAFTPVEPEIVPPPPEELAPTPAVAPEAPPAAASAPRPPPPPPRPGAPRGSEYIEPPPAVR